jgi:type IV pilus assembly protein PilM
MASQGRPILGIDINAYEIRVVEMRGTWNNVQIIRAGVVPTPRGAVVGDRITYPETVADILRGLLDRMRVSTREAVIGMGPQTIITRVMDIPNVPEKEARAVILGELEHYQILREGTGAFDSMRLDDPMHSLDATPHVLLMAAEEKIIAGYRETAERAGLQLVALEPVLLAMFRAAFPEIQTQSSAMCVAITYGKAEVAIVDHGAIRLYRRMDIGSDDLIAGRDRGVAGIRLAEAEPKDRVLLGTEEETGAAETEPRGISQLAASNLATELQRSLDYYRREFPQASSVTRIVLVTNDPEIAPLAEWLYQALRLEVTLAEPPISIETSRAIAAQLEAPSGLRFLGAAGLGLHRIAGLPAGVPSFDLSIQERREAEVESARRHVVFSLSASIAIVLIGIVLTLVLGRNANQLQHEVDHKKNELGQIQQIQQARLDEKQRQISQLQLLKMEGFPFPRVMDAVASALDPQAGLTEVGLDRAGKLSIQGEAANEKAIIRTLDGVRLCPYFENTTLDSFESTSLINQARVIRFQISSQFSGIPRPESHAPSSR